MNKWDDFGSSSNDTGAKLVESSTASEPAFKAKHLKSIPAQYFEDHKQLKAAGKTSLNFSDYIVEALREKLAQDKG